MELSRFAATPMNVDFPSLSSAMLPIKKELPDALSLRLAGVELPRVLVEEEVRNDVAHALRICMFSSALGVTLRTLLKRPLNMPPQFAFSRPFLSSVITTSPSFLTPSTLLKSFSVRFIAFSLAVVSLLPAPYTRYKTKGYRRYYSIFPLPSSHSTLPMQPFCALHTLPFLFRTQPPWQASSTTSFSSAP